MKSLCIVCLLLPAACLAEEWNQHYDVAGTPEVHVFSGNVPLRVHGGSGSGVDVEVKTKGYAIGPSGVHVESHVEGNRVELRFVMPEHESSWGNRSVEFEVRVPQTVHAFIDSGNGPIELRDLHGTTRLHAGNGPIEVEGFAGSLDSETQNGPVHVNGRFESLNLRMGNGPLDLFVDRNSQLASSWHVETGNGPISIRLPEDVRANLSVHTGHGPFSFDLPGEKQMVDEHEIRSKLNGGGPELSISTGHGPVSIGRS